MMLIANDSKYMGQHSNGAFANVLGWLFFGIIVLAAFAALPLFFLTSGGQL
jgi:Mn2+/Fe2+ NRAMP family transporter